MASSNAWDGLDDDCGVYECGGEGEEVQERHDLDCTYYVMCESMKRQHLDPFEDANVSSK